MRHREAYAWVSIIFQDSQAWGSRADVSVTVYFTHMVPDAPNTLLVSSRIVGNSVFGHHKDMAR